jgi:hypothetical protein
MAEGQMKGNKEIRKPKADKNLPEGPGSAYKQSPVKSGPAANPFGKKN